MAHPHDSDLAAIEQAVTSFQKLWRARRRELRRIMPAPLADIVLAMEWIAAGDRAAAANCYEPPKQFRAATPLARDGRRRWMDNERFKVLR